MSIDADGTSYRRRPIPGLEGPLTERQVRRLQAGYAAILSERHPGTTWVPCVPSPSADGQRAGGRAHRAASASSHA